jgi:hypothetical protein
MVDFKTEPAAQQSSSSCKKLQVKSGQNGQTTIFFALLDIPLSTEKPCITDPSAEPIIGT